MAHEIKSAIILAAGRGKRLENLTDEQPKPLCKVRGEVLIERLIEQLQAKGIDDIYVVVGYKYWKFDYLNEKYAITLVYNKKWFVRTTSSRSLRAMKNFLVVQSRMAQLCSMQTYTSKMTV